MDSVQYDPPVKTESLAPDNSSLSGMFDGKLVFRGNWTIYRVECVKQEDSHWLFFALIKSSTEIGSTCKIIPIYSWIIIFKILIPK